MKTILITGLDGSGKSTLLNRLQKEGETADVIFVPHIAETNLEGRLLQAAQFVNQLSRRADEEKVSQLKALALFASMILFQKLVEQKEVSKLKFLFFERHPLIDTGIYARFYASKLGPGSISSDLLGALDSQYRDELNFIIHLLPSELINGKEASSRTLIGLIYNWFHIKQQYHIHQLQQLFKVSLPDELYFLQASPEVLYDRIKSRKTKEAHESIEVFRKLGQAYEGLMKGLQQTATIPIHLINANSIAELDALYHHIATRIHES